MGNTLEISTSGLINYVIPNIKECIIKLEQAKSKLQNMPVDTQIKYSSLLKEYVNNKIPEIIYDVEQIKIFVTNKIEAFEKAQEDSNFKFKSVNVDQLKNARLLAFSSYKSNSGGSSGGNSGGNYGGSSGGNSGGSSGSSSSSNSSNSAEQARKRKEKAMKKVTEKALGSIGKMVNMASDIASSVTKNISSGNNNKTKSNSGGQKVVTGKIGNYNSGRTESTTTTTVKKEKKKSSTKNINKELEKERKQLETQKNRYTNETAKNEIQKKINKVKEQIRTNDVNKEFEGYIKNYAKEKSPMEAARLQESIMNAAKTTGKSQIDIKEDTIKAFKNKNKDIVEDMAKQAIQEGKIKKSEKEKYKKNIKVEQIMTYTRKNVLKGNINNGQSGQKVQENINTIGEKKYNVSPIAYMAHIVGNIYKKIIDPDGSGVLKVGDKSYKLYEQFNALWEKNEYGNKTIGSYGCGPSTVATILTGFKGVNKNPADIVKEGKWITDSLSSVMGSDRAGDPMAIFMYLVDNGLTVNGEYNQTGITLDEEKIYKQLNEEKPIGVFITKPVQYVDGTKAVSTDYHYVSILALDKDGKIFINDSYNSTDGLTTVQTLQQSNPIGIYYVGTENNSYKEKYGTNNVNLNSVDFNENKKISSFEYEKTYDDDPTIKKVVNIKNEGDGKWSWISEVIPQNISDEEEIE